MAEVVEADVRKLGLREEPRPRGTECVGTERRPAARIDDGVIVLPGGAQSLASGRLIEPLSEEVGRRNEGRATARRLRLVFGSSSTSPAFVV
jgi:hypothetical protein